MACDPAQLAEDARCIEQCIPEGLQLPVLILLAQQIAGDTRTAEQLANDARCISCVIPEGDQVPVLIKLACDILG